MGLILRILIRVKNIIILLKSGRWEIIGRLYYYFQFSYFNELSVLINSINEEELTLTYNYIYYKNKWKINDFIRWKKGFKRFYINKEKFNSKINIREYIYSINRYDNEIIELFDYWIKNINRNEKFIYVYKKLIQYNDENIFFIIYSLNINDLRKDWEDYFIVDFNYNRVIEFNKWFYNKEIEKYWI
jgi:hypothetical protein